MAEKEDDTKKPDPLKKPAKKLTIIDANEPVEPAPAAPKPTEVPEAPAAAPTSAGDTPALADEEELAAIAEAFADLPDDEEALTSSKAAPAPASKKITVSEHVEEPEVTETPETPEEAPKETAEEESTEEPAENEEVAEPEEEPAEEPVAAAESETEPASDETTEEPAVEESEAEEPTGEEGEEEPTDSETEPEAEAEPEPEPVPPVKPLSQLTNNVPQPPKVTQDIAPVQPEKEFADTKTASAVDDIVATESDELLAQEDAAAAEALKPVKKPRTLKSFFKSWWGNPAARWGTIVGLILLLMLVSALPTTRYTVLNAFGIRAKSSVIVISNDSQQPLKNAEVSLGGQTATTDEKGTASFQKLKLGKTDLKITKRGFASVEQSRTLGWGSNPLGSVGMTITGTRFIFVTKDYLSGKAVLGAEATSGEYNAQSDKDGKIILSIDQNTDKDFSVTIKAEGYRDEVVPVKLTDKGEKTVQMVPSRQHVFISKRSGKLDIYKIGADGKDEKILLAATGSERNDLTLLPQIGGDYAAIVSTRAGKHNKDGYLMSNLLIVNVNTGELTTLNLSERIQLVDWSGDRIVFVAVTEGASAANPSRSKLYSYQIGQPGAKEIASANYFNDVAVFKGAIYYAPSSYAIQVSSVKFYKVNPDGSGSSSLLDKEVWNIFRSDYDTLLLSVQQDWYELKSGGQPTKLTAAPANPKSRIYRDSPDKKVSLWVDNRDGKGVLISYDNSSKKETTLQTQSGLSAPYYWLNNSTYVYRISDGHETADYVKSVNGGDAKKLRDVTATDTSNYFN